MERKEFGREEKLEARVNRLEFLKKIKTIEKAISENKIKPIISCAYLETDEAQLKFYGTNLEITIITAMEAEIKSQGKMVFQHQIVEEYLKELKDEYVNLKADEFTLLIETEDSSTEFSLMNWEEFPKNYINGELLKEEITVEMESSALVEAFEKTKFAASQSSDDMRINCIRIVSEENSLKFIGTDTYRLVYFEKEMETKGNFSVSLPLNTVDALTKLLKSLDAGKVKIHITSKNTRFEIENTLISSRIIELPFPDYDGILKNLNYDKRLKISSGDFLNMLKRVIIFVRNNSESKYGAIYQLKKGKMTITGSNEIAKINEESHVDYSGEEIKISLNTKFLIEFLQNLNSNEKIFAEFTAYDGSVRIKEESNDKYIYIVMPLALKA